ncbi:carboxypeptidase-like regulatory domain-containing protein [Fuerstiella marisgermanici]|uniref:Carboxypeptidase regulatory-like domain-containing protein n=1 Tax=Fuerstiella marisgermanici TaxID=1891926 RepID=A0A1P8WH82_9PLAN|nr:carboxypeptidase-like regulatory domain-containing protein [Fuerstiella marisgermanici]APZ93405.1 hypothetical protein Fuma_03022 [Fuerstiella marisgermanici]
MATYAFNEEAKKQFKAAGKTQRDFFDSFLAETPLKDHSSPWQAAGKQSRGVSRPAIVEFIDEINRLEIPFLGEDGHVHLDFAKHVVEAKKKPKIIREAGSSTEFMKTPPETTDLPDAAIDKLEQEQPPLGIGEDENTDPGASCSASSLATEGAGWADDSQGDDHGVFLNISAPWAPGRSWKLALLMTPFIGVAFFFIQGQSGSNERDGQVAGIPPNPTFRQQAASSVPAVLGGSVIDAVTNKPIVGVKLTLLDIDTESGGTPVCRTDPHGRFRFEGLSTTQHRQVELIALKSGYEPSRNHVWLGTHHFPVTFVKESHEEEATSGGGAK